MDVIQHRVAREIGHLATTLTRDSDPRWDKARFEIAAEAVKSQKPLDGAPLENFSLSRLVRAAVTKDWSRAGFEREVCATLAPFGSERARMGGAMVLPWVVLNRAAYAVGAAGTGGNLVETDVVGFVDALRAYSGVLQFNPNVIDGLSGNVAMPSQNTVTSTYWVGESVAVTEAEGTFAQSVHSPKTVGAISTVSRLFTKQVSAGTDGVLGQKLLKDIGVALDAALLVGSGAGGQPTGILNAGITSASGTTLSNATLTGAVATVVAAGGVVDPARTGTITTAAVAAVLAQRIKAGLYVPLWESGTLARGQVAGFPAVSTSSMTAGGLLFGDYSNVTVLQWGQGIEVMVNEFASFGTGDVQIRSLLSMDVHVAHPGQSFTAFTSVT